MNKLLKYIFCLFVFALPLFFIPNDYFSQDLGRTFFLIIFSSTLLFYQFIDIIKSKKYSYNFSNIFKLSSVFFAITFLSFIFSKNTSLSLWGRGAESFISLISIFIIFYFSRLIKKEDILSILEFFVSGVAISVILFLFKIFTGVELELFNNLSSLSIIVSVALVILISFAFKNIKFFKDKKNYNIAKVSSLGFFSILFLIFLVIVDYRLSWLLILVGTFFVFWGIIMETKFNFKRKKVIFSSLLLVLFLFLFFFPIPFSKKIDESRLSYDHSFLIAQKSLIESPKNFILGSGLGTYSYQFSLYKDKNINLIAPNYIFSEGSAPFLTFIVTLGLFGSLSLFILILIVFKQGFKKFIVENDSIFPVIFCLSLPFFFYRVDVFLIMLFFFFLGLSEDQIKESDNKGERIVKPIFFLMILFFSFSVFTFLNYIRSDIYYKKSISYFKNGESINKVIAMMDKSENLFVLSDYSVSLSSLYLLKAEEYFEEKWVSKEKKEEQRALIEENVLKAENYIKKASEIDPNNFRVWQRMGLLYENVDYLIGDKKEEIVSSYEKAKLLAPQNCDIYVSLGNFFVENKDNEKALVEYRSALNLNCYEEEIKEKIKKYEQ